MTAYYNENNREAAAWLRELIKAKIIADGYVDERDIRDVQPRDLDGFVQCHFFAGVGVWSYALRLAGWRDDEAVWTGSCPCQPFSAAGGGAGFADERHLWPSWFHLIEERRPGVVFGEQVASPDGLVWLELVQADMEGTHYAFGPDDLCAAGFGAPHIRQRSWFVAESGSERLERQRLHLFAGQSRAPVLEAGWGCEARRLADTDGRNASAERQQRSGEQRQLPQDGLARLVADSAQQRRGESSPDAGWLASGDRPQRLATGSVPSGHVGGFWRDAEWIYCRDGKYRPVEPGTFPLAHGAPARVGRLRGYGNAIVAEAAAAFIGAYLEAQQVG